MKFRDLSIKEKAAVIKLGVGGGLNSLLLIEKLYDGLGPDDPPIILKVNKSQADFVLRLKDPNREYIHDWENPDNIATHKLSWADDGVVYPLVLNVNGRLVDFSRPPYSTWAGYDNAVRNGDTIHMTPEEAEWFTTHYKDYYPGFNEYAYGGPEDPPKKRFKTPEEILAEKYSIEPMVMDNVVLQEPVVTLQMKNEYASTPLGLSEQFGTIGKAENTNAFQRKVREIRNSDNPMWFGAYFVPYLGQGMLLSNAAERIMSGQYGLGLFDTGLAFAPYLSKTLKPFIRNTRKAFEFNINPTNANSGIRTEYPWLNWNSTTELSPFARNARTNIKPKYDVKDNINGWTSINDRPILEAPKTSKINSNVLFGNNFFDLKPYTPEWTENGIGRYVDRKGMINRYEFENLFPLIEKDNFINYHDPRTIFNKNQGKQRDLLSHSYLVAKTANDIPLPKDITRQEMVFSALMHDIGKTINPKNTHGQTSARLVNQLIFNRGIDPNSPEYVNGFEYLDKPMSQTSLNAKIFNAIYRHMDADSYLDKHPESGLLQALRFADVSRGLNYDLAAAKYPHLLTYDKDLPVMHKLSKMSFRDDLKYKVNPALKALKLQTVDLNKPENEQWELLENIISEYRTFLRGARDPLKIDIFNANKEDIRNAKNASLEALIKYGADTPESRTRLSAEYIPINPTGSGRMGVFDVVKDKTTLLPEHKPGEASKMIGINPKTHDVNYVSTSNTIANTYKLSTDNRTAHAYFVELPFEKHFEGEMPSEFMLRSDYDMYDIRKLHHGYPLGTRSMYEIPYRLQTGKSLQLELKSNMPDDIKPKRIGVVYPSENATPEEIKRLKLEIFDIYETGYDHILDWMDRSLFSEDALNIQEKIDNYYRYQSAERSLYKVNNKLKDIGSSFSVKPFEKNGMINKDVLDIFGYDLDDVQWLKGMISDNDVFEMNYYNGSKSTINKQKIRSKQYYEWIESSIINLADKGYISQKQKHSILQDYRKQIAEYYNNIYYRIPGINTLSVDTEDLIFSLFVDKIVNNVKKYINFDLLTSKTVKKYIENTKKKQYDFSKVSKYLKDPERQLEFLREHDVTPRFELPSFNQQIVLANQMPKTPKYLQNQIIHAAVLGKKGEKVLNIKDILDESLLLKRKAGQGRDQGEVLPFGVSKKAYKLGGPIKPFSYLPIPEVRY